MGRTSFEEKNVVADASSFPKLKLEKGETARIVCLEDPWSEFVHNLRAPKMLNGKPVIGKFKRMDGTEYETNEMDFIGNPICLGDPGILIEKGKDPKNCPACAASEISDNVQAPKRRHAMHVMQYATRQGSGQIADPFSVQTKVWAFTEGMFIQLVNIASEFTGGLPRHDLVLGPCEDKNYQKFKITPSEKAEWLMSEDRKQLTVATFKGNQTDNLADPFCGTKREAAWINEALTKIKARWNLVNGVVAPVNLDSGMGMEMGTLTQGLDELLNGNSSVQSATASPSAATTTMDDLLSAGMAATAVQTPAAAAAPAEATVATSATVPDPLLSIAPEEPAAAAPKPGSSGETVSFDDLISSLGS